jgi:hypothetical protein
MSFKNLEELETTLAQIFTVEKHYAETESEYQERLIHADDLLNKLDAQGMTIEDFIDYQVSILPVPEKPFVSGIQLYDALYRRLDK